MQIMDEDSARFLHRAHATLVLLVEALSRHGSEPSAILTTRRSHICGGTAKPRDSRISLKIATAMVLSPRVAGRKY